MKVLGWINRYIFAGRASTASDADTHEVVVDENGAMAIRLTSSNFVENPAQTAEGQTPVSVSESFLSRLFREGRQLSTLSQGTHSAPTANQLNVIGGVTASPGCEFYPTCVMLSCNEDAQLVIKYVTNVADAHNSGTGTFYEEVWAKAGTPFIRTYNGDVRVYEGGSVSIAMIPTTTTAKLYGSIYGIEVTSNA